MKVRDLMHSWSFMERVKKNGDITLCVKGTERKVKFSGDKLDHISERFLNADVINYYTYKSSAFVVFAWGL